MARGNSRYSVCWTLSLQNWLTFNTFKHSWKLYTGQNVALGKKIGQDKSRIQPYTQTSKSQLHENRELYRQLLMTVWHVAHVLILGNVFIIDKNTWIPWIPVAAIVVNIQLLVVEAIVGTWSTPCWERADIRLRPWIVCVIHSQGWNSSTIEIEWIECIPI